jgi:hypothetical protein
MKFKKIFDIFDILKVFNKGKRFVITIVINVFLTFL